MFKRRKVLRLTSSTPNFVNIRIGYLKGKKISNKKKIEIIPLPIAYFINITKKFKILKDTNLVKKLRIKKKISKKNLSF